MSTSIMTDNEIPQPTSMQELEVLIKTLYDSQTSPGDVSRINRTLQKLQNSPQGWQLAMELTSSAEEFCQFFSALTFTIKLNTDWQSLSEEHAAQLLNTLILWFVRLLQSPETKSYIWRKLCVALVIYFIRFSRSWSLCVRHLFCCITANEWVSLELIHELPPTTALMNNCPVLKKDVMLNFAKTLAEEVGKLDDKNAGHIHQHEMMEVNISDVVAIISSALAPSDVPQMLLDNEDEVIESALECFQTWAYYAMASAPRNTHILSQVRNIGQYALSWIKHDQMYTRAASIATEILVAYPPFFINSDKALLADILVGPWGMDKFSKTVYLDDEDYDPEENTIFPQLLLAFAEGFLKDLAMSPNDPTSKAIFEMLHQVLRIPGHPYVDEDVSDLEFNFWSSLIDLMDGESTGPGVSESWMQVCRQHLFQAIQEYWVKIRYPMGTGWSVWTKDDKASFTVYRADVSDIVETAYPQLHTALFNWFVVNAMQEIHSDQPKWDQIEASLTCISALSEGMTDEPDEYQPLASLLESSLFVKLADSENKAPLYAQMAGIVLIGKYAEFFKENSKYLAPVLNFLFSALSDYHLVTKASRSIFELCSACRTTLVHELPTFITQYHTHITAVDLGLAGQLRERVTGALGCLIQALPTEEAKIEALELVLESFFESIKSFHRFASTGKLEEAKFVAQPALKCLVSLGKGLQAPDDLPISIPDDEDPTLQVISPWSTGKGLHLRQLLASAMNDMVGVLHQDFDIVETACNVYRAGFKEDSPGLLVFEPAVTTEFLINCMSVCVFYDAVMGTASAFIQSHTPESSSRIDAEANLLARRVYERTFSFPAPNDDPELVQNCLEFMHRLIPRYLKVFLQLDQEYLYRLFTLAVDTIISKEQFPRKAACVFWTTLITATPQSEDLVAAVVRIVDSTGERLTKNIIEALGGGCARSEIDFVTDLLKKIIFRQPQAKKWIDAALFSHGDAFPDARVTLSQKTMFLRQIINLRGGRGTNQVGKDFWTACRGIGPKYTP